MKTKLLVAKGIALVLLAAGAESVYAQAPSIGGVRCSINGRPVSCDDGPSGGGGGGGGGQRGPDVLDAVIDGVINLFGLGGPSPAEYARQRQVYELHEQGRQLSQRGDRRGALEKYRAALALDPTSRVIHLNIANNESALAYEAGDLQLAIAKAREATAYSDDPAYRRWLNGLEEEFTEQQRGQQANGLTAEGIELWKKGNIKGALAKFQAASALRPSEKVFRDNVALAERRIADQQAKDQDVETLRAAAKGALTSLKQERAGNVRLNLEAFRPGNPPPEEVAAYLTGQGTAVGPAGPGHPAPAGDQLRSAAASGGAARETVVKPQSPPLSQSASDREVPAAAEQARLVFDTPGQAAGSLPTVNLRGMRRGPDGAPIIPPERRTQKIKELELARNQYRARRLELGQEISSLDTKLANPTLSGPERQTLLVKKAELKQEEFTNRQEEIFLNFSIELEDAKTTRQRTDANVVQDASSGRSEPPGPPTPSTPSSPSPAEERRVRP